jgi:DNA-binding transcriptional LysR family regulator
MQMHQIRYFLALRAERSFTRAAKRSGVSQPSLTNAIGALERELGGTLFHRKPLVALTALGHAIVPYLEQIAQNADRAGETARTWREMRVTDCEAFHPAAQGSELFPSGRSRP